MPDGLMPPPASPATPTRSGLRQLLVPSIATAVMFAVLVGLGVWQLERLAWKQAILAQIDRAEASPPVPLGPNPLPFQKVAVEGTFRAGDTGLYAVDVRGNQQGAFLVQPLDRPGQDTIIVQRGWVPEGTQSYPQPPGPVVGYVRAADKPGTFTPADDITGRHFYTLDAAAIGRALGVAHPAPFTIVAFGSGQGLPAAATELPRPPNDHLNYALTWFGLALTLLVVFAISVRKVLRP